MIEVLIKNYLNTKLNIPIGFETPKTKPSTYVIIQKLDGGRSNMVDYVTLEFVAISNNYLNAATTCRQVKKAMYDAVELSYIAGVKNGGESQGVRGTSSEYESSCIFNITYYDEEE